MPNITASIPHQLTRDEAKRRIQSQLGSLRSQGQGILSNFQESWSGDDLAFSASAMGQSASGNLKVDDHAVHLEVALPWLFAMLTGTIKQTIESRGQRLLGVTPRDRS